MRLLRSFPMLAYAVVLLSIVGVCIADRSVGLLLVTGVLAVLSWYVTEGPRGRSLPNWTANVLIIAVSLNVVVDVAQHQENVLGALGRFIVWLTLIKLYQHKGPRDYAQLLGLSLLLMLIGCLRTANLLFAATLLAYAVLGLYVLLLFQLYAAYERGRASRLSAVPAGYRLVPSLQPIMGRRAGRHLGTLMLGIAAAGLVLSGFLFVLFPRHVGEGLIRGVETSARSGFSGEIDLLSGTRITESRKVVMNLRLAEGGLGSHRPLHLRGAVLTRYQGRGRWTGSPMSRRRVVRTEPPGFASLLDPEAPPAEVAGTTITQEFELLVPSRTVFSLNAPVAIATPDARRFGFDPATGTIEYGGSGRLHRYTVRAQTPPSAAVLAALEGGAGSDPDDLLRQFAGFDWQVSRLARGLLASTGLATGPPDDESERWAWRAAAARVLTDSFHTGGFRYDLDLRDVRIDAGEAGDPIVQFLFRTRRGHCEYFASALTAMCNSVGVPARLVTGYVALEFDESAGVYIVRESNAHAWVEALVAPHTWRTFDPTPPATLRDLHGARHTLADRWRWLFDRFEARWINSFIAFDGDSQARLIKKIDEQWGQRIAAAVAGARQWAARVNRAFYLGPAGYIWMGIVALALLIAAVAAWTRLRRAARLRATLRLPRTAGSPWRRLGFYLDMLSLLERAGLGKPDWQPPLLYARSLAYRHPEEAALVRRLTRIYYAARYGDRVLERDDAARAGALLQELARLVRSAPARRRGV